MTHTSYLGVREGVSPTWGACDGVPDTTTFFHLGTWGPAVIMDGPVIILSGTPPPGYTPFVCPSSGNDTRLWMIGTSEATGVYTYTVRAHLSNGSDFDVDCVHTVERPPLPSGAPGFPGECPLITISPSPLPEAGEGITYSQQLSGVDGTGPYTFDLLSGALPTGLILTSGGLLSGIPTTLGIYSFSIRLTDLYGCTAVIISSSFEVGIPPVTDAGDDQIVYVPLATMDGTITGDGTLTGLWEKVSGPGAVVFTDDTNLDTDVQFSLVGEYVLKLTGTNEFGSSSDTVTIQIVSNVITAPDDCDALLLVSKSLTATYNSTFTAATYQWSKINGPGNVTFSAETALTTNVTFSENGMYVLAITATNGSLVARDYVVVRVLDLEALPGPNP